jgi:hypothetical protein
MVGPTVVVTQVRPGALRVRDHGDRGEVVMAILFTGLGALFGGGAAAGTAAASAGAFAGAAATGAATTAASGISLGSILQGAATVLGVIASIGAGNAEADKLNLQAQDAEREVPLENLQGIERRTSIKKALAQQLGDQSVAYAGSGLDLGFGTATQARTDAIREADTALTTDTGTQQTRVARLFERATDYRSQAKQAKRMGLVNGLIGGLTGISSLFQRGA